MFLIPHIMLHTVHYYLLSKIIYNNLYDIKLAVAISLTRYIHYSTLHYLNKTFKVLLFQLICIKCFSIVFNISIYI